MILRKSLFAALLVLLVAVPELSIVATQWEEGVRIPLPPPVELLSIPEAHAQDFIPGSPTFRSTGQRIIAGFLNIFVVINWVSLSAVQALLDPDVIFGEEYPPGHPAEGERPMELILRNLWVTSRNIVNGFFAFVLLFAGIYLIAKSNSDAMQKVKAGIPHFILAVILVNFSWFIPRVILDVSSLITSTVFQLPALVDRSLPCTGEIRQEPGPDAVMDTADDVFIEIPCRYVWRVHFFPIAGVCAKTPIPPEAEAKCARPIGNTPSTPHPYRGDKFFDLVDVFYYDWYVIATDGEYYNEYGNRVRVSGADVIINGLAVNFAKVPNFGLIDFKDSERAAGSADDITKVAAAYLKFFVELVMHTVLSIVVGLALLALAAVLVVRIAVIWLCIAFMPFAFIGFALRGPGGMGELGIGEQSAPNIWKEFIKYALLPAIVAVPFALGFTLMSSLYYVRGFSVALPLDGIETIFPHGIDSAHEFLWMLITIAIIWFGVFGVLASDKIAAPVVNTIKGIGTTGAKIAGYGIAAAPIMPLSGGRQLTLGGMAHAWKTAPLQMRQIGIERMHGPPTGNTERALIRDRVTTIAGNAREKADLATALRSVGVASTMPQLRSSIEELASVLQRLNVPEARSVTSNKEYLNQLIELSREKQIITRSEYDALKDESTRGLLEQHYPRGTATAPVIRVHLNVESYRKMARNNIQKDIAEQYFHSGLDGKAVKRDLQQNIERATVAAVKEAIRGVENQITDEMDTDALKAKLKQINPDL